MTGALLAAGLTGAVLTLAGVRSPVAGPLTAVFLLIGPAVATASSLPSLDPPARLIVAGAAAAAMNAAVAETMLAVSAWSPRGGIVAVGVLSAAVAGAPRLWRVTRSQGSTAGHPTAGAADDDESWVFED